MKKIMSPLTKGTHWDKLVEIVLVSNLEILSSIIPFLQFPFPRFDDETFQVMSTTPKKMKQISSNMTNFQNE